MGNNFDIIKNYDYEDEEIVFNSDDYNECVRECDRLAKLQEPYVIYAVYPSDKMLEEGYRND